MAGSNAIRYFEAAWSTKMNFKVKVENHTYNVTVGSTKDMPILVDVDGVLFEVWPELVSEIIDSPNGNKDPIFSHWEKKRDRFIAGNIQAPSIKTRLTSPELITPLHSKTIRAPIPGVITAVYVTPGAEVRVGEELFKLDAMKMNNSIRSNRSGVIRDVMITVGQVVKNNEVLVEFAS